MEAKNLICLGCGREIQDPVEARPKFFRDASTGRVISLVRHDVCAGRYVNRKTSNLIAISREDLRLALSPAKARENYLKDRRNMKAGVLKGRGLHARTTTVG